MVLPTYGWGKQSTWLAASGSLALFAGVARTHSGKGQTPTGRPLSRPCRPCVPVSERMEAGAPVEGIWTALGRVWGGGCLGQVMTR